VIDAESAKESAVLGFAGSIMLLCKCCPAAGIDEAISTRVGCFRVPDSDQQSVVKLLILKGLAAVALIDPASRRRAEPDV